VRLLTALVLAGHLLCMNLATAGPLICLWLDRRARTGDPDAWPAVRLLAAWSAYAAALGAAAGLALGALYWSADYRHLLGLFASRIGWGAIEFLFSLVLLAVYAGWILARPVAGRAEWLGRSTAALLAATNLLYHFPPLFTMLASAAAGQIELSSRVDSATFRQLLMRGDVLALTAHYALASLAVSGALVAVAGSGLLGRSRTAGTRSALAGARVALAATILQLPVGLWVTLQIAPTAQHRLLGEDLAGTGLFLAAISVTFWLLHQLAAMALGDVSEQAGRRVAIAICAVVLLMSAVLQRVQTLPDGSPRVQRPSSRVATPPIPGMPAGTAAGPARRNGMCLVRTASGTPAESGAKDDPRHRHPAGSRFARHRVRRDGLRV
jgi:hypothetical protein